MFSDAAAVIAPLWTSFAWVHDAAAVHSPILWITSAQPNSGKTTLAHLIGYLTPRSLLCTGVSEAALFRSIELWSPTMIVTEADKIWHDNEPLRAAVNSGYTRGAGVKFPGKEENPKGRKVPQFRLRAMEQELPTARINMGLKNCG